MKRRDFLKLIGISPIVPGVLAAKERIVIEKHACQGITVLPEYVGYMYSTIDGGKTIQRPIGFSLEDIPKDKYGWVWVTTNWTYAE